MLQNLLKFTFSKFVPSNATCWNCQSNDFVNRFICGSCKYLKKPTIQLQDVNYFEIFDLPVKINVDSNYLKDKYRALQLKFHPDRFVTTGAINISYSQEYSAFINEAFSTLINLHKRAEYLLNLKGYQIKECSVLQDIEFMEEMLDQQAAIQFQQDISNIALQNEKEIELLTKEMIRNINNQDYEQAYTQILYLRYRLRLRDQINMKE